MISDGGALPYAVDGEPQIRGHGEVAHEGGGEGDPSVDGRAEDSRDIHDGHGAEGIAQERHEHVQGDIFQNRCLVIFGF